ncbi:cytochrome [Pseudorhodobacter sp. E13]|uniref:cytochrome b/b6 domain-containing protein n=1 Tax=Pseudorhodobacter sp. E13 TaxID=2487931 RepID=UPI000F8D8E7C|nr:cytochrome b/b6 domain-containing protein [Pseudorhodobacter sp. E13]RUS60461.1 cytochrome [Pseudorhodobacter sp. E13]
MPLHNTPQSFGSLTRVFHWLTALLILTAIPLGIIANDLPFDTSEALALKAQLFSLHKTLGVAAFLVAGLRILWALGQTRPLPLHPDRRAETLLAEVVHWLLYASMLLVPLSGWVHHAATSGFAPILWPLGQDLPLVPKSENLATAAAALHWVFTKLLIASLLLHIAGALKHHLIDKDATLHRMVTGARAPIAPPRPAQGHALPAFVAVLIYAAGSAVAVSLAAPTPPATQATDAAPVTAITEGNWQVQTGQLALTVQQLGSAVTGDFGTWQADIRFDPEAPVENKGSVTVTIDTTSLSLGSVSDQAKGPDFLNVANHGTATFTAQISGPGPDYTATGSLTLLGQTLPLNLPFTLSLNRDSAEMTGQTSLDRRDFGIGSKYPDEASVGYDVDISVTLTAKRIAP